MVTLGDDTEGSVKAWAERGDFVRPKVAGQNLRQMNSMAREK